MNKKYFVFILLLLWHTSLIAQDKTSPLSSRQQSDLISYKEQLIKFKAENQKTEVSRYLNKMATIYWEAGLLNEAIEHFSQALEINKELGNPNGIAGISNHIGMIYFDMNQYEKAIHYLKNDLQIRQQLKDKTGISSALINIGIVLQSMNQYKEAIREVEKALTIAKEVQDIKLMKRCYGMLAENYQKLGNAEKSIEYFNTFSSLDKHLLNEELAKKEKENNVRLGELENRTRRAEEAKRVKEHELKLTEATLHEVVEISKERQLQIELLKAENEVKELELLNKELALKEKQARLDNEILLRNSFISGFLMVCLLAFALFRGYKLKQKANYELSRLNSKIIRQKEEIRMQNFELENKNNELVELNNEKNYIIGIVAHDLRSPVNQIKGLVNLIKITLAEGTREQMEIIDLLQKSAERIHGMIGQILDVNAIESKGLNIDLQSVSVGPLLNRIMLNYKDLAARKHIRLHLTLHAENSHAKVDPNYLTQVFENLLSNAVKFSPFNKNVHVNLSEVNNKVRIEFKDEGPGIKPEEMLKLFGKFQKLEAKPTGGETSTGLGLSIVKKYMEAMNGKIWCESEFGKGANFIVELDKTSENVTQPVS